MWTELKDNQAWRLYKKIKHQIDDAVDSPKRYTAEDLNRVKRENGTLLFDIKLGVTDVWSLKAAKRYAKHGIPPVFEHGLGRNACGAYLWKYLFENPDATYEEFRDILEPMCLTNRTTQTENHQLREVQIQQPFGTLWTWEQIYKKAGVQALILPLPAGRKAWSQPLMKSTLEEMGIL